MWDCPRTSQQSEGREGAGVSTLSYTTAVTRQPYGQPYGLNALRVRGVRYWWAALGFTVLVFPSFAAVAVAIRQPAPARVNWPLPTPPAFPPFGLFVAMPKRPDLPVAAATSSVRRDPICDDRFPKTRSPPRTDPDEHVLLAAAFHIDGRRAAVQRCSSGSDRRNPAPNRAGGRKHSRHARRPDGGGDRGRTGARGARGFGRCFAALPGYEHEYSIACGDAGCVAGGRGSS